MDTKSIIHILTSNGVTMEKGLNMQEIKMIENLYEIHFPPDFVELLSDVLPTSDKFINWRDFSKDNVERIKGKLNWPLEGLIFDIDNNDFWYAGWGNKPENIKDAIEICKNEIKKAPKLIPIYSHRYIPSEPWEEGNPIFSVYQTDIIYYGEDLLSYFEMEFTARKHADISFDSIKRIRFWSDLL